MSTPVIEQAIEEPHFSSEAAVERHSRLGRLAAKAALGVTVFTTFAGAMMAMRPESGSADMDLHAPVAAMSSYNPQSHVGSIFEGKVVVQGGLSDRNSSGSDVPIQEQPGSELLNKQPDQLDTQHNKHPEQDTEAAGRSWQPNDGGKPPVQHDDPLQRASVVYDR